MVQTFSTESFLPLPWPVLAQAYFLRYPNPYAQHVLSLDVLDRRIIRRNPQDSPVLLTHRLLLKKGTLPSWAPRGLIKNAESWVLEVTEVDLEPSSSQPRQRQMRTWTRNLDHTTVLAVAEGLTFTEDLAARSFVDVEGQGKLSKGTTLASPPSSSGASARTHCLTSAHITSDVSVLWRRIEKFGLKRFKAHIDTSRQGLLYTASHISEDRYPHRLSPPPVSNSISRLREALRPPWLDGLPLGPVQRARRYLEENLGLPQRYRTIKEEGMLGYTGRREREEGMRRWREELRERLVRLREWRGNTKAPESTSTGAATVDKSTGSSSPTTPVSQQQEEDTQREAASSSPASGKGLEAESEESIEVQRERLARLLHEARRG